MEPLGKVGDKPFVIPTTVEDQGRSAPSSGESVWSTTDEQVSSEYFWPGSSGRQAVGDSAEGFCVKPSEMHRLRKFAGSRPEEGDGQELGAVDAKITETVARFRAAPRGSRERDQLAAELDALKASKQALEDEAADLANWQS